MACVTRMHSCVSRMYTCVIRVIWQGHNHHKQQKYHQKHYLVITATTFDRYTETTELNISGRFLLVQTNLSPNILLTSFGILLV